MFDPAALRARLDSVRDRIATAARRAGRDPSSVRLLAISKTFPPEFVREAARAGQIDFGENKVQEALAKQEALADLAIRWHLVGHLQSNKARKAVTFDAIHSIDSVNLLQKVDEAAAAAGRAPEVLIQVDLAQEATKFGAPPAALPEIIDAANTCRATKLRGLMVLPPVVAEPELARPFFARLRTLMDEFRPHVADPRSFTELSMGMSHDFEAAIAEGATMVRVGSAIFGDRPQKFSTGV